MSPLNGALDYVETITTTISLLTELETEAGRGFTR